MLYETRINRWKQLYDPNPEEKIVLYLINPPGPDQKMPVLNAANKQERIDYAKHLYEWQIKNVESFEDDSLPHLYPVTGTEIFAEAFGCRVLYPEDNMPFALPMIFDSSDISKLKVPALEDTPLMMLFDIADELKKFAGNDALLRLPDIQCPMDISALICEKRAFFLAMAEDPQAVIDLSFKVRELLIAFLNEWFQRYGTTYIAHFPNYYMESGITMSVDEIGCVSPLMFNEFFADEINDLSRLYGGVGIHCCAEAKNQWENLRQVRDLKLLNLHREREQIFKAYDYFKGTCVQMHYLSEKHTITAWRNITPEDIDNILPQKCRVVIPLSAQNDDDAKEIAALFGKYR